MSCFTLKKKKNYEYRDVLKEHSYINGNGCGHGRCGISFVKKIARKENMLMLNNMVRGN